MRQEHLFAIPTFVDAEEDEAKRYDWSRPHDVRVRADLGGVRVILGDSKNPDSPDVLIERTPDRWRIFVHPDEGDPVCIIEVTTKAVTIETQTGENLLTHERTVA